MKVLVVGATGLVKGAATQVDVVRSVPAADVGQAFVRSVHGVQTGQVFAL